jgi:hypothetical protein
LLSGTWFCDRLPWLTVIDRLATAISNVGSVVLLGGLLLAERQPTQP